MAKRNRHREIQKFGSLQGVRTPLETMRASVTEEHKMLFGGLVLWTHNYVNYVYEHAGHHGKPQEKRVTEPLYWRESVEVGRFIRFPLTLVAAGRWSVVGRDYLENYEEYKRQTRLGNALKVELQEYPDNASRSTSETINIETNADGIIVKGRYDWIADAGQERLAPDADFSSLDEAHEATVTGRGAYLLWRFRNLVVRKPELLRLDGTWGMQAQIMPPEELIPIPKIG